MRRSTRVSRARPWWLPTGLLSVWRPRDFAAGAGAGGSFPLRAAGGRGGRRARPGEAVAGGGGAVGARGRAGRGFVGMGSQRVQLPEPLRQRLGLGDQETGLLVVTVEAGGPAEQGGLMLGDIIVAFGGETLRDPGELRDMLG